HLAAGMAAHAVCGPGGAGAGRDRAGDRGVAARAPDARVRAGGDLEAGVVRREACTLEARREMAALAVGAEPRLHVVERSPGGARVVRLVALEALARRAGEGAIAPVEVTLLAGDGGVAAGEREIGAVVGVGAERRLPGGG